MKEKNNNDRNKRTRMQHKEKQRNEIKQWKIYTKNVVMAKKNEVMAQ